MDNVQLLFAVWVAQEKKLFVSLVVWDFIDLRRQPNGNISNKWWVGCVESPMSQHQVLSEVSSAAAAFPAGPREKKTAAELSSLRTWC